MTNRLNIKNKVFFLTSFSIGYWTGHVSMGYKPLFIAILFAIIDYVFIFVIVPYVWNRIKFMKQTNMITKIEESMNKLNIINENYDK